KERQTLQPLLSQPVTRPALVLGKWLTLASLGGLFCSIAFIFGGFVISKAPLAAAGATFYLDFKTLALGAVSLSALAMFAASAQVFLAANAKTYREAMTYLPWTALLPFAVTFVPIFTDVEYDGLISFVPIFNQTFVMRELLLEGVAPTAQFLGGIVTTLGLAVVFLLMTMRIFGNEKSLG
ncbi:MAG: ABC transporter permease subunit, partial [Pseudomonadota bacterium]